MALEEEEEEDANFNYFEGCNIRKHSPIAINS
jgi:hypothetical protein